LFTACPDHGRFSRGKDYDGLPAAGKVALLRPSVGWAEAKPNPSVVIYIATLGFGGASTQPTGNPPHKRSCS